MKNKTFFIKPALGLTLRDPETQEILPEQGALMPKSAFWLRRLNQGDVFEIKAIQNKEENLDLKQNKKNNKESV